MQIGAVYLRVSTEDQTEYSPQAQLGAIKEYARKNDIFVSDEFVFRDEGISGRSAGKRPAFQAMISAAKKKPKPFDVILVHKFDRFARNREDSIVYKSLLRKDCGIRVISVTEPIEDDKMSVIMEAMLEAMAEYYSLNLADEVRKGMFEKARRGEKIGKPPFGYKLENSKLVPHETEAEAVKKIFEMYRTESVSKITQYLNRNGITPKSKGVWRQSTLIYMLQNPVYYGVVRYNYRKGGLKNHQNDESEWILAPSDHTPLISKEIFEETQKKLLFHTETYGRNFGEKSIKSWAQHVVRCGGCGNVMVISTCDGGKYKMFRCQNNQLGKCDITNTLSVRKLENMVFRQLKADFKGDGTLVIEKVRSSSSMVELDLLNARLKKIEAKQELVKRAYLAEADTLEEYKQNKKTLQKEEDEILSEIEKISKDKQPVDKSQMQLDNYIMLLESPYLSIEDKNKLTKQFIKEIDVDLITKEISIIYYI